MALSDWFRAEFELLETRVAMAKDASAALAELIAKVEKEKSKMTASLWRKHVDGICAALELERLALLAVEDAQPPIARSPMQRRKRRLVEAAIVGMTELLAKPSA